MIDPNSRFNSIGNTFCSGKSLGLTLYSWKINDAKAFSYFSIFTFFTLLSLAQGAIFINGMSPPKMDDNGL